MNKKVGLIVGVLIALTVVIYVIFTLLGNDKQEVGDLEITHELGTTLVKKNPEKVIVFDYGVLDTLDKIGVDVIGLPKSSTIPDYLSKYSDNKYVNVGSLQEPLFEDIFDLNPDLIIISARQRALYDQFKEVGPTIFLTIDNTDYLTSFKNNLSIIGSIFDKEEEINTEVNAIETKISSLYSKATNSVSEALIVLLDSGALNAFGEGSRFGIIHKEFGVKAADKNIEVSTHGQIINYEFIEKLNPDIMFVIDRGTVVSGGTPSNDLLDNDIVNNTDAAKNDMIIYLDAQVWYLSTGGITSTNKMIEDISKAFE